MDFEPGAGITPKPGLYLKSRNGETDWNNYEKNNYELS